MTSLRVVRWILVALTAALAVVLIVSGHVVLGVLLGAMAVTRAVLFVKMQRRREMLRARIAQRRGSRGF
ncbi:MAG: hypothetical protein QOE62_773 [Actinomycetota bacterium]|jgi:hypothetical protein|nr:hypothetical protein [Actinomycetota bacterium]